jgi:acyl carrier protein
MIRLRKKKKAPRETLSNESEIRDWLSVRVAQIAETSPEDVDPDRPLADFGLDSVQIAEISADLEDAIGRPVPETAPWEYPTIATLAAFLSNPERVSAAHGGGLDTSQW